MESTYRLVKHFEDAQPDVDYLFIIGVDLLSSLHEWMEADKLLEETKFIVFKRQGYDVPEEFKNRNNFMFVDDEDEAGVSSTQVRQIISEYGEGDDLGEFLRTKNVIPEECIDIIVSNGLYK